MTEPTAPITGVIFNNDCVAVDHGRIFQFNDIDTIINTTRAHGRQAYFVGKILQSGVIRVRMMLEVMDDIDSMNYRLTFGDNVHQLHRENCSWIVKNGIATPDRVFHAINSERSISYPMIPIGHGYYAHKDTFHDDRILIIHDYHAGNSLDCIIHHSASIL